MSRRRSGDAIVQLRPRIAAGDRWRTRAASPATIERGARDDDSVRGRGPGPRRAPWASRCNPDDASRHGPGAGDAADRALSDSRASRRGRRPGPAGDDRGAGSRLSLGVPRSSTGPPEQDRSRARPVGVLLDRSRGPTLRGARFDGDDIRGACALAGPGEGDDRRAVERVDDRVAHLTRPETLDREQPMSPTPGRPRTNDRRGIEGRLVRPWRAARRGRRPCRRRPRRPRRPPPRRASPSG